MELELARKKKKKKKQTMTEKKKRVREAAATKGRVGGGDCVMMTQMVQAANIDKNR